jgi:hypothetical protein
VFRSYRLQLLCHKEHHDRRRRVLDLAANMLGICSSWAFVPRRRTLETQRVY